MLYYTHINCDLSFCAFVGPEPMDISTSSTFQAFEIPSSDVTILEGHTSEVCDVVLLSIFSLNLFLTYSFLTLLVGLCLCMESSWFSPCIRVCLIELVFILVWLSSIGSFKGLLFYLLDSHT